MITDEELAIKLWLKGIQHWNEGQEPKFYIEHKNNRFFILMARYKNMDIWVGEFHNIVKKDIIKQVNRVIENYSKLINEIYHD